MRVLLQPLERVLVQHDRRDPGDHVRAERLLLVEDRAHRLRQPRLEVEQRRDDGRRAQVEGDRVAAAARVAGFHVDQQVVGEDGGHLPVGRAQHAAEPAHDLERDTRLDVVHRIEQPLEVRALVLERRLGELDVALLHRRPQDHVAPHARERGLRPRLQRRHLDREVLLRVRAAREPPAALQLLDAEGTGIDRRDRRVPGDDLDLALLARAVAAAGRVDGDAVPARGVEDRRAGEHARLLDGAVFARLEEAQADAVGVLLLGKVHDRAHVVAAACFSR